MYCIHLVNKYNTVEDETAPLHKLGGTTWGSAKKKATKKAYDIAAELLEINAKRALKKTPQMQHCQKFVPRCVLASKRGDIFVAKTHQKSQQSHTSSKCFPRASKMGLRAFQISKNDDSDLPKYGKPHCKTAPTNPALLDNMS